MDEFDSAIYTEPLRGWVAQRIGMSEFARTGCLQFGTAQCLRCDLAQYIPRSNCDPPDECLYCEHRYRCPCGSDAFRNALLRRRSLARGA